MAHSSREYFAAHYQANKERIKARVRARYAEKRAEILAAKRQYNEANKEALSEKHRRYYAEHRSEIIARVKVRAGEKREEIRAYKKEWWASNADEFAAKRKTPTWRARVRQAQKARYDKTYHINKEKFLKRNAKRRAMKARAVVGPVDFAKVLRDSGGLCGICRKPLDLFGTDFDHIVPLSRGGAHTQDNIQAAHAHCNRAKGSRLPEEMAS